MYVGTVRAGLDTNCGPPSLITTIDITVESESMDTSKIIADKLPYTIRDVLPSDIPFIYSSWLKSFRFGSQLAKPIRSSIFYENYREVLDCLLSKSQIKVACLNDEPSVILGYLVYERTIAIVHYVFVKEAFRELGIAHNLLLQSELPTDLTYSHMTTMITKYLTNKSNWIYNPFVLYSRGCYENEEDSGNI